ncbi:MAG TPA: hypothetical protein VMM37_08005 [Bacteroidota bacterium]|nr:hypothetical protein [Bacteroidota bacterium]
MKRHCVFVAALAMLASGVGAQTPVKKYDIKSGIVSYETVIKMGKMEIKSTSTVSFDDYGMKECRETYSDGALVESFFSDGKDLYAAKHRTKKVFKQGPASRGTELRVEWTEFGTEKDRQSGHFKKLPSKIIAGKECEMFEQNDGKGTVTQYGGWNKILFYLGQKSNSMETTQRAVKVEENARISPEKFMVPRGYSVQ